MAQQFKVLFGASLEFNKKLYRGPCILPNDVAEALNSKMAGRSGKSCLSDAIQNGFVIPMDSVQHHDGDILNVGVRQSETPFIKGDTNTDPKASTPKDLLVSTTPGSPTPLPMTPPEQQNAVSSGETLGGPVIPEPETIESEGEKVAGQGQSTEQDADPAAAVVTNGVDGSGWNLQDEQLEGRDLDNLNVMIVERLPADEAGAFVPYETVEEARAHLQADLVEDETE